MSPRGGGGRSKEPAFAHRDEAPVQLLILLVGVIELQQLVDLQCGCWLTR